MDDAPKQHVNTALLATVIGPYRFPEAIAALPWVRRMMLFGSRARGTNRPRADFDLAVDCPGADAAQWQQLVDLVEEADTLNPIDLVRFDVLDGGDPLRANILRDAIVLFERHD